MNKIGIHYAFWGNEWDVDISERIKFAANVGFDSIDVTPPQYMIDLNYKKMDELRKCSEEHNVDLNFCIGFPRGKDMASHEKSEREAGIEYSKKMFEAAKYMGSSMLSGIIYSSWPYMYNHTISEDFKKKCWEYALESVSYLLPIAKSYGITYAIEPVNRFEQFILNSVDEGLRFCEELGDDEVGLLIDTFHANIEEDSIADAIRKCGKRLKHMHICENNRKVPGTCKNINWPSIFEAINDIQFEGDLVMEPFIEAFGPVGNDIRIWRNLESDLSKEARDKYLRDSIEFVKNGLNRG